MLFVATLAACLPLAFVTAEDGPGDGASPANVRPRTDVLRSLVRQLIDLQSEQVKEDAAWTEQKSHLEALVFLHEKEVAGLKKREAEVRKAAEDARAERKKVERRITAMEALLSRMRASIRDEASILLDVYGKLPPLLRTPIAGSAARLRDVANRDAKAAVPERLRVVTAFAASLHSVLRSAHAGKRVVERAGGRREMDVLFLGGAQGYYVSPDGKRAGLLVRKGDGWDEIERDEIAGEVREAIAIVKKERPARMIRLPLPRGGEVAP
jgi:hypothetical protein